MKNDTNSQIIAEYIAATPARAIPSEVLDAARLCLVDWIGVCVGAIQEPAGKIVHSIASSWKSQGKSTLLLGGRAAPPFAALCNGTLAHCLDFDDTYVKAVTHTSAPVWAATLAVGEQAGASEQDMLAAFITGFETAARIGYGLGEAITARGWHGTGVFGRMGAAAASAVLLKLNADQTLHALGAAATQTSGLVGSFGTMSKPFHAGKAAMDGVISAQLAREGFQAATALLEPAGALDTALIQDRSMTFSAADFSQWEILNNSFKPYAACHLTHPAIDAARNIDTTQLDLAAIQTIRALVGPLAKQVTGEKSGAPASALEGKFDLKYCIALALHGHTLSAADFREPFTRDDAVFATARKILVEGRPEYTFSSARLELAVESGQTITSDTPVAKGHPGNPMGWGDMWEKFDGLANASLGAQSRERFEQLRAFGSTRASGLSAIRSLSKPL